MKKTGPSTQPRAAAAVEAKPAVAKPVAGRTREPGPYATDDTDERIIAEMRKDGRISNRDLAKLVGVNEATVRTRLRRLEESNTVRVVAMRDLFAMGYQYLCAVGVQVKARTAAEVGADLAKIPEVMTVNVTIGAHDLEVQLVAREISDVSDFINNVMANVPGVARLTPALALKVFKYESRWAPLS
jgi:Lrp/AsnC family transcriptional regulator for asnA, asnC and gidA